MKLEYSYDQGNFLFFGAGEVIFVAISNIASDYAQRSFSGLEVIIQSPADQALTLEKVPHSAQVKFDPCLAGEAELEMAYELQKVLAAPHE